MATRKLREEQPSRFSTTEMDAQHRRAERVRRTPVGSLIAAIRTDLDFWSPFAAQLIPKKNKQWPERTPARERLEALRFDDPDERTRTYVPILAPILRDPRLAPLANEALERAAKQITAEGLVELRDPSVGGINIVGTGPHGQILGSELAAMEFDNRGRNGQSDSEDVVDGIASIATDAREHLGSFWATAFYPVHKTNSRIRRWTKSLPSRAGTEADINRRGRGVLHEADTDNGSQYATNDKWGRDFALNGLLDFDKVATGAQLLFLKQSRRNSGALTATYRLPSGEIIRKDFAATALMTGLGDAISGFDETDFETQDILREQSQLPLEQRRVLLMDAYLKLRSQMTDGEFWSEMTDVSLVGKKDSGKVVANDVAGAEAAEFTLSRNLRQSVQLWWHGQDLRSKEAYGADSRFRYVPAGSNLPREIDPEYFYSTTPVPGQARRLEREIVNNRSTGRIIVVTVENGVVKRTPSDMVICATGFRSRLQELIAPLQPITSSKRAQFRDAGVRCRPGTTFLFDPGLSAFNAVEVLYAPEGGDEVIFAGETPENTVVRRLSRARFEDLIVRADANGAARGVLLPSTSDIQLERIYASEAPRTQRIREDRDTVLVNFRELIEQPNTTFNTTDGVIEIVGVRRNEVAYVVDGGPTRVSQPSDLFDRFRRTLTSAERDPKNASEIDLLKTEPVGLKVPGVRCFVGGVAAFKDIPISSNEEKAIIPLRTLRTDNVVSLFRIEERTRALARVIAEAAVDHFVQQGKPVPTRRTPTPGVQRADTGPISSTGREQGSMLLNPEQVQNKHPRVPNHVWLRMLTHDWASRSKAMTATAGTVVVEFSATKALRKAGTQKRRRFGARPSRNYALDWKIKGADSPEVVRHINELLADRDVAHIVAQSTMRGNPTGRVDLHLPFGKRGFLTLAEVQLQPVSREVARARDAEARDSPAPATSNVPELRSTRFARLGLQRLIGAVRRTAPVQSVRPPSSPPSSPDAATPRRVSRVASFAIRAAARVVAAAATQLPNAREQLTPSPETRRDAQAVAVAAAQVGIVVAGQAIDAIRTRILKRLDRNATPVPPRGARPQSPAAGRRPAPQQRPPVQSRPSPQERRSGPRGPLPPPGQRPAPPSGPLPNRGRQPFPPNAPRPMGGPPTPPNRGPRPGPGRGPRPGPGPGPGPGFGF